jgi:alpha-tubulin suppressor-like RCC1 family protein
MNKLYAPIIAILFLTINLSAQINRRDTKKSVVYRANYQRIANNCDSQTSFEIRQGTLWAWGNNQYGQLGDGTRKNDSIPKQIGTDNNWVTISTGYNHSVGLKSDGTLWAWGGKYQWTVWRRNDF